MTPDFFKGRQAAGIHVDQQNQGGPVFDKENPMQQIGHHVDAQGQSAFRVFAPEKRSVRIVFEGSADVLALTCDELGFWQGACSRLPHGTLYWLEVNGQYYPDPASRYQPQGVHGPSRVTDIAKVPSHTPAWRGVRMADAIIYELHVGTFTAEGTLAAATDRLADLAALGITVIELLPLAAFPGERNWGYDGVAQFALHQAYGDYPDLTAFIVLAHQLGMAVILDVVYNHFGPEGNYTGALAPYTKPAATPWGAAINFDVDYGYGIRAFFLANLQYWLQQVGFDGLRMDAVSLIFDNSPVHILRDLTDLALRIGQQEGREVLMIAEHLRNNRFVTHRDGFNYQAQWSDDLNHAVFAYLTGETRRHYGNFGAFGDIVKALQQGFVLDGSRFERVHKTLMGTDGRLTQAAEHVVHLQNHDQVGNRVQGDRMIATYGRARALLGITAIFASPFVPMLFMGEEYGETAPFLFFVDFKDQHLIDAVRKGRKRDCAFGGKEPPAAHHRSSFEASKLQSARRTSAEGQAIWNYYRALIALKRSGALGPHDMQAVKVQGDEATQIITVQAPQTLAVLNFSADPQQFSVPAGWRLILHTDLEHPAASFGDRLPGYAAYIFSRA
ncbi:MAG: malto-oligosyltrehalose trehalohydrolase [Rhodoferax sp.]|nr:malto-oligosyltrehalose trehalohydrolase [Rhodoferax sp.]